MRKDIFIWCVQIEEQGTTTTSSRAGQQRQRIDKIYGTRGSWKLLRLKSGRGHALTPPALPCLVKSSWSDGSSVKWGLLMTWLLRYLCGASSGKWHEAKRGVRRQSQPASSQWDRERVGESKLKSRPACGIPSRVHVHPRRPAMRYFSRLSVHWRVTKPGRHSGKQRG